MSATTSHRLRLALVLIVAGYFGFCWWQPEWMALMGVGKIEVWFLDLRAVLAASDAHALGIPPGARNPLDFFHQPHVYSDWWFALGKLHLARTDHLWLGGLLGVGFLAVALLQLPARSAGELGWSVALLCSPPMVFGFNRANADLLMFILLSAVAPALISPRAWLRWSAVAAIVTATGLKFYPAAALLLLLVPNRPRREIVAQLMVGAIAIAAIAITQADTLVRYVGEPTPSGFFTFGAEIAPRLVGAPSWVATAFVAALLLLPAGYWWRHQGNGIPAADATGWSHRLGPPLFDLVPGSGHVAGGEPTGGALHPSEHPPAGPVTPTLPPPADHLRFILGAVVLTSCYFATVNYAYRAVCVIWMAPFLWRVWSAPAAAAAPRRLCRLTGVLLSIMLWFDAICCLLINTTRVLDAEQVDRWTNRLLLLEQPIIAALVITLLGFILPFARDALRLLLAPAQARDAAAAGSTR